MELSSEQWDLVDFAYSQNKRMGANLTLLYKFGVVGMMWDNDFKKLLDHLKINKDFNLITGFEYNAKKRLIWLDSISEPLKQMFRGK